LAEALRDPSDGAPVGAAVEEVCGLEKGHLIVGKPAEDRLRRGDGGVGGCPPEAEELGKASTAAPAVVADHGRRRRPLLEPPVLEGDLLAERADVDEVRPLLGREAHRTLAQEEGPLANCARPDHTDLGHAHGADYSPRLPSLPPAR